MAAEPTRKAWSWQQMIDWFNGVPNPPYSDEELAEMKAELAEPGILGSSIKWADIEMALLVGGGADLIAQGIGYGLRGLKLKRLIKDIGTGNVLDDLGIAKLKEAQGIKAAKEVFEDQVIRMANRAHSRFPWTNYDDLVKTFTKKLQGKEYAKIFQKMTGPVIGKTVKRLLIGGGVFTVGSVITQDALLNWAVLDDVMAQRNILFRDISDKVDWGKMDPERARTLMDEQNKWAALARDKLQFSTTWNPIAMIAKRIWLGAADASDAAAAIYYDNVTNKAFTQSEERQARIDRGEEFNPNLAGGFPVTDGKQAPFVRAGRGTSQAMRKSPGGGSLPFPKKAEQKEFAEKKRRRTIGKSKARPAELLPSKGRRFEQPSKLKNRLI